MGLLIAMTDPYTLLFYGWVVGVLTVALPLAVIGAFRVSHGR
jgi:hypothetical protein